MSIRKRNEFLEDEASDDEQSVGYDSDAHEESRGDIGRGGAKRRKIDAESDDESFAEFDDDDAGLDKSQAGKPVAEKSAGSDSLEAVTADIAAGIEESEIEEDDVIQKRKLKKPASKPNTLKGVAKAEKAAKKSGVIYISRVPPFMKPHTLKHFLEAQAPKGLGRVFLTPEDHAHYLQRKKSGGNKKKSFTDGWVEFVSKKDAKVAAETLNGNIIGGKKGGYYHDDMWNIKYLKGFKWSHLTEQIASENAEREARMREEIRRTRKENKSFLEDVERGKMLEGMETKRKAKGQDAPVEAMETRSTRKLPGREFKQAQVQSKTARTVEHDKPEVKRALSMIF